MHIKIICWKKTWGICILNKFPLIEGAGGGGGGGLGPPSKKSSIEGKLGGSPPGPNKLLLPPKLLFSPSPLLLLFLPKLLVPLSLSNLFLFQILFQDGLAMI